jgi:hypothetical protein
MVVIGGPPIVRPEGVIVFSAHASCPASRKSLTCEVVDRSEGFPSELTAERLLGPQVPIFRIRPLRISSSLRDRTRPLGQTSLDFVVKLVLWHL